MVQRILMVLAGVAVVGLIGCGDDCPFDEYCEALAWFAEDCSDMYEQTGWAASYGETYDEVYQTCVDGSGALEPEACDAREQDEIDDAWESVDAAASGDCCATWESFDPGGCPG